MLRPAPPSPNPPPRGRGVPPRGAAPAPLSDEVPQAVGNGSLFAIVGCTLTTVFLSGAEPSELGRFAAIGTAFSLAISVYFDFRAGGLRNLIRADLMALVAFYFLTFFEFLFPQPNFDNAITPESARTGIIAVEVGFIGMLIGRHLYKPRQRPLRQLLTTEVPPSILLAIFWSCVAVGYLHMLLAVDFDVAKMVKAFTDARFTQPWSRGRLGDWKALVIELGMFIYLIPPLAGIILARRQRYNPVNLLLVTAGLLFTLFYGFTSGTRNVFASYLVTMLIGYAFALPRERQREIVVVGAVCAAMMVAATPIMLAFRNVGISNWLKGDYTPPPFEEKKTVFVDYNLLAICKVMEAVPAKHDYLGLEIPYTALIRPIPRAIWPSKPEGLSFTIEDAMEVSDLTISATFVGEAYMASGYLAVLLAGLFFGALTGWWSHLASPLNSELGILIYASGFFAAVISMRSLFVLTTAMLPTLAAITLGALIVKQLMKLQAQLAQRREAQANRVARGQVRPTRR
jgi:hypothetical protein